MQQHVADQITRIAEDKDERRAVRFCAIGYLVAAQQDEITARAQTSATVAPSALPEAIQPV